MPRIQRTPGEPIQRKPTKLARLLADELKANRDHGQPLIEEQVFESGLIRVRVLWDRWHGVSFEGRSKAISQAYRIAGEAHTERITLTSGLTFSEAARSGLLPYQVLPVLRSGDAVTLQQCQEAMIEEGASKLIDPRSPQLRFPTEQQAVDAIQRISQRLPDSEPVWQILGDAGMGYRICDGTEDED